MHEQLVQSGRRVHSPAHSVFRCSGRADWVNARRCSAWQYAWAVWSLGNAADKGFSVPLEALRSRDVSGRFLQTLDWARSELESHANASEAS